MATHQPTVDVNLRVDPTTCDLSRQTRFSLVVLLTLHSERSVTVAKHADGLDIGLDYVLQSGAIKCIDTVSGERIPIFDNSRNGDPESNNSRNGDPESTATEAKTPSLLVLNNNRADYITFTSAATPREYEFVLDIIHLEPNREYTIRCHPWELNWWSYTSVKECLDYFDVHAKLPPTQSPPLHCSPSNRVSFSCQANKLKSPQVDVSLAASSTLSLSSTPAFRFSTTFTSHASQPFTALAKRRDAISLRTDIEILDATTRKRAAPDLIDVNDSGLYEREDFLYLNPGKPHVEERSLSMKDGLEELQPGSEYILRFSKDKWMWWHPDSIDDVMRLGKGHGWTGYFSDEFSIHLVCRDEVRFLVVD